MASHYICNRCGKKIDEQHRIYFRLYLYGHPFFYKKLRSLISIDDKWSDLCDDCFVEFDKWLENGTEN